MSLFASVLYISVGISRCTLDWGNDLHNNSFPLLWDPLANINSNILSSCGWATTPGEQKASSA